MTPWVALAAIVAGGIGAGIRYLVDQAIQRSFGSRFPWGIVIVNVTGSLLLGITVGWLPEDAAQVMGIGLLGGYTTFSTAMLDAVLLWQQKRRIASFLAAFGTAAAAILAAAGGLGIGYSLPAI